MSRIVEVALGTDLAGRLQDFVRKVQQDLIRRNKRETVGAERLNDLEADLGFLAMLQVATLRLLDEKGLLRGDDLLPHLMLADKLDGVEDGSLSLDSVRNVIGLPRRRGTGGWASSPVAATVTAPRASSDGGERAMAAAATQGKAAAKPASKAPSAKPKSKPKGKRKA